MSAWHLLMTFILVFSDTFESHIERLASVFQRLEAHGLKLKGAKCEFFNNSVTYLGHIISEQGIASDPEKTFPITSWPVPTNITQLRSFLGTAGFYRRFIKDYAKIAQPLNSLLEGHSPSTKSKRKTPIFWSWDDAQQVSFDTLKSKLTSPPVLAFADYTKPFILHTDASGTGLGAVLLQQQEDSSERVIAYASRGLRRSERNYPAHK